MPADRGRFVTFEGPDGSGKTTQLRLLYPWLVEQGYPVIVTREPGGTVIGEQIRALLHDCARTEMSAQAEILLYSASRAQLVAEFILPALDAGKWVLCDRYYDSTFAYQGYGRGLSLDDLRAITRFATQLLKPDLTLYLDVSPEIGLQRRAQSGEALNRLDRETLAFHRRVREGYLALAAAEPERWITVDASLPVSEVQAVLRQILQTWGEKLQ
ncbi:MAG: dTMP kinase [Anaerolineae bacterium]|nr:dTMP kinase [Anaerolineae bacterium]